MNKKMESKVKDNVVVKIKGLTDAQVQDFWEKLKGNFDDPIIKILIFALCLNVFFAFMGKAEWYESVGIAMAVLLATMVSTNKNSRARRSSRRRSCRESRFFESAQSFQSGSHCGR